MRLSGRVAIVTGAGQGIGKGETLRLASEGASVIVADIDLKAAEEVALDISAAGSKALALKVDVSSRDEVEKMVSLTISEFGRIDILVNSAGVALQSPALEMTEQEWDRDIDINLKGTFLCNQAVAREMIKRKKGKIINIASVAAHRGTQINLAYSASKAGVIALTRSMAIALADYNINVNVVSPGPIDTQMIQALKQQSPEKLDAYTRKIPLSRLGTVDDLANIITFLASDESDFITGQEIIVDGGILALHPSATRE